MLQEGLDLLAEAVELHAFLATLKDEDWGRPTAFQQWTPWDVVAHLHFYDCISLVALEGREAFAARRDALVRDLVAGVSNAELGRREYAHLTAAELVERWMESCRDMAKQLGESDPEPPAAVVRARHGRAHVHDRAADGDLGARPGDLRPPGRAPRADRPPASRRDHRRQDLRLDLRQPRLEPPGPPPYVRLVAPSGAIWEWNEPERDARACAATPLDFCQVVAQTRNVADTKLEVVGPVATRWMSIAQCFAGPPVDPPKPGERDRCSGLSRAGDEPAMDLRVRRAVRGVPARGPRISRAAPRRTRGPATSSRGAARTASAGSRS